MRLDHFHNRWTLSCWEKSLHVFTEKHTVYKLYRSFVSVPRKETVSKSQCRFTYLTFISIYQSAVNYRTFLTTQFENKLNMGVYWWHLWTNIRKLSLLKADSQNTNILKLFNNTITLLREHLLTLDVISENNNRTIADKKFFNYQFFILQNHIIKQCKFAKNSC